VRLHTFRSPDFGILGQADHDGINIYRQPIRRHAPDTEFDIRDISELPRVDIVYAYAGADETTVNALIEIGTKAIIVAGFAPGSSRARHIYCAVVARGQWPCDASENEARARYRHGR